MRTAFSSMAWNTGSSSPGDALITRSTSEVAVWLLQRFGKLTRTLLLSLEQPDVFDRNHRLVGEGFSECDLFVSERLHEGALEKQNSNGRASALQWDAE